VFCDRLEAGGEVDVRRRDDGEFVGDVVIYSSVWSVEFTVEGGVRDAGRWFAGEGVGETGGIAGLGGQPRGAGSSGSVDEVARLGEGGGG